jgi:hypothetical protein
LYCVFHSLYLCGVRSERDEASFADIDFACAASERTFVVVDVVRAKTADKIREGASILNHLFSILAVSFIAANARIKAVLLGTK